ncbi:MAG: NAD(P)H-dependent oxidoreductase [Ferruginibacter sp.]|nr:NAD(P)H-dependent oxidoreductase [Ferruginibacter sp.]
MITIISGSLRVENNTKKVASVYYDVLQKKNIDVQLLSLDEVNVFERHADFIVMEKQYLIAADAFIIVMPEYNGSYPGILKLMIDNSDVAKCWHHKKVLLTGVSTGRAGNLRGMEHLSGSLMHMKMLVHPNRLPISMVDKLLDENQHLSDAGTLKAINSQLDEFLKFSGVVSNEMV